MPVDLNSSNISNQANILANTENAEVASTKSTTGIDISQGIMEISEGGGLSDTPFSGSIPVLEEPTVPLENILSDVIEISNSEKARLLGVELGTKMTGAEFIQTCLDRINERIGTEKGWNLSKIDSDTLSLFCLLLTQGVKEKMIKSFKELLKTKITERTTKQDEYAKKTTEASQKQVEKVKEAEKAKKRAKFWGIFKAVLGAVVAVAATVLAIGVTAASFGSMGPVAMTLAITAVIATVASTALTLASSGVTIAALCTEDPEKQAKLNKWSMGLGIAAAAVGISAAILSGGATFGTSLSTLAKILSCASGVISGCSQMATGAVDIYEGVKNIELAKLQRELADMKIDLTKLDETIALLNKLIETLSGDVEEFIKNLLEGEQQAAKELINISDAQAKLAQEKPSLC